MSIFYAEKLNSIDSDGLLGLGPKPIKYGSSGKKINLLIAQLANGGVLKK